jgi:outer membrane protein TolC
MTYFFTLPVLGEELDLRWLIDEAQKNNREILMVTDKAAAAEHRILPAQSLPDPMVTFGYQNTSLTTYNYNKDDFSYWIVSASQMFPYLGKRGLKGDMARADAEGQKAFLQALKLRVAARVKELYYDLSWHTRRSTSFKTRSTSLHGSRMPLLPGTRRGRGLSRKL